MKKLFLFFISFSFLIPCSSIAETSVNPSEWDNYQVSFTMQSDDDDAMGLMFRYQDPQNYYRFSWDKQRLSRRLVKCENGSFTILAEDNVPYVQYQSYQILITATDTTLELAIDGTQIFSVNDSSFPEGTIAPYSCGNVGSHFSNITVLAIPSNEILLSEPFLS